MRTETSDQRRKVGAVLVVKSDQIYGAALGRLVHSVFPTAAIKLATSVAGASAAMAARRYDLLLTGIGASLGGDMLDLISLSPEHQARTLRVLVVTTHHEAHVLTTLHTLAVHGVFDSFTEDSTRLSSALRTVGRGEYYWSRSILDHLHGEGSPCRKLTQTLTNSEQVVLSIIGDGSDDDTAARELGLSPATISCFRRNLHRKLGVQHRGELMRLAAQHGFVRYIPAGVVRTGFAMLAAGHSRRPQRAQLRAV